MRNRSRRRVPSLTGGRNAMIQAANRAGLQRGSQQRARFLATGGITEGAATRRRAAGGGRQGSGDS